MQLKVLFKKILLVVVVAGFAFSASLAFYFIPKSPIQNGSAQNGSAPIVENTIVFPDQEQALQAQEQTNIGLPVRLKIPSINVDSAIEYVGLTSNGAMDAPKKLNNVAWFNIGPRPGEIGSAVIAGHYGIKDGKASVFDNLYKLRKGDKLYVEDDKGKIISFVVRESRRYDPNADARAVFGSNNGKSHLNLVTCEGVWDKISKSYSKRLVVFTDKE